MFPFSARRSCACWTRCGSGSASARGSSTPAIPPSRKSAGGQAPGGTRRRGTLRAWEPGAREWERGAQERGAPALTPADAEVRPPQRASLPAAWPGSAAGPVGRPEDSERQVSARGGRGARRAGAHRMGRGTRTRRALRAGWPGMTRMGRPSPSWTHPSRSHRPTGSGGGTCRRSRGRDGPIIIGPDGV